jgi:transcriptional regulator with XRE-family HTH domain
MFTGKMIDILRTKVWRVLMGRKRLGPSPKVDRYSRVFAEHLNRLMLRASVTPAELAQKIGKSLGSVHHYLQGGSMPRLQELPVIAGALNLSSVKDLIPDDWPVPQKNDTGDFFS